MEKPEKFKCSKSTGVDDLHPRVWKEMKCEIADLSLCNKGPFQEPLKSAESLSRLLWKLDQTFPN